MLLFFPLWTQCTTSCGPGYQMRAVKCVVGSYGAVMDDTECNAATRPTDTQVRRTLSFFLPCLSSPLFQTYFFPFFFSLLSFIFLQSLSLRHCDSKSCSMVEFPTDWCWMERRKHQHSCTPTLRSHTYKHTFHFHLVSIKLCCLI